MKLQQKISADVNKSYMGKIVDVLIDEPCTIQNASGIFQVQGKPVAGRDNQFAGRTEGDAPEVDGCVYVSGRRVRVGEFCRVRITDTLEYDLVGEAV